MPFKSADMRNVDPAKDQLSTLYQSMNIVTNTASDHKSGCLWDSTLQFVQLNFSVPGDHCNFLFIKWARFGDNLTAGTLNQQPASRNIPKVDALFDISVEASAGHVSKIKSSATHHPAFPRFIYYDIEGFQSQIDGG